MDYGELHYAVAKQFASYLRYKEPNRFELDGLPQLLGRENLLPEEEFFGLHDKLIEKA